MAAAGGQIGQRREELTAVLLDGERPLRRRFLQQRLKAGDLLLRDVRGLCRGQNDGDLVGRFPRVLQPHLQALPLVGREGGLLGQRQHLLEREAPLAFPARDRQRAAMPFDPQRRRLVQPLDGAVGDAGGEVPPVAGPQIEAAEFDVHPVAQVHVGRGRLVEGPRGPAEPVPAAQDEMARLALGDVEPRRQGIGQVHREEVGVGIGGEEGEVPSGRTQLAGIVADLDQVALAQGGDLVAAQGVDGQGQAVGGDVGDADGEGRVVARPLEAGHAARDGGLLRGLVGEGETAGQRDRVAGDAGDGQRFRLTGLVGDARHPGLRQVGDLRRARRRGELEGDRALGGVRRQVK